MASLRAITSPHWASRPDEPGSNPLPVALFLHGYGADEQDLISLEVVLPPHIAWASVRAPLTMPFGGAAWFELSDVNRPDPQAVALATAALWEWIDAEILSDTPIVPIGFSQGGMVGIELLRSRPHRIPAMAFLSSYVVPTSRVAPDEPFSPVPEIFWGRGDQDPLFTADTIAETGHWLHSHTRVSEHVYPGLGHGISLQESQDLQEFLQRTLAVTH